MENSNVSGDTRWNKDGTTSVVNRWAYYTFRIPAEKFEYFLQLTHTYGNVLSTSRSAQNVTSSYTDFEARLSSLNTQEERLLDMLSKSTDVETLIALEQRLSDVRYEIEAIERNLRNYDAQIRYSTIDLSIQEVELYTPTVPIRRSFGEKLEIALSDGWTQFVRGTQNLLLGLAASLPALILLLVLAAASRHHLHPDPGKKAQSKKGCRRGCCKGAGTMIRRSNTTVFYKSLAIRTRYLL